MNENFKRVRRNSFKASLTFSANNFKQLLSESAASFKLVTLSCSVTLVSNLLDVLLSASSSFSYKIKTLLLSSSYKYNHRVGLTVWFREFSDSTFLAGVGIFETIETFSADLRFSGESGVAPTPPPRMVRRLFFGVFIISVYLILND